MSQSKKVHYFVFLSIILTLNCLHAYSTVHTIYGHDSRKHWYEFSKEIKALSKSTVAMVNRNAMYPLDDNFLMMNNTLGSKRNFCQGESPWTNLPSPAHCSGVFISDRHILTAAHCIPDQSSHIKNDLWVGQFMAHTPLQKFFFVPKKLTFKPTQIINLYHRNQSLDAVIIEVGHSSPYFLDIHSKLTEVSPRDKEQDHHNRIIALGHPEGLPLMQSQGKIRDREAQLLITDLDAFQGSSGSMIYDQSLGWVGMLVHGGRQDYSYDSNQKCWRYTTCLQGHFLTSQEIYELVMEYTDLIEDNHHDSARRKQINQLLQCSGERLIKASILQSAINNALDL